jgi:hypothetical protein
VLPIASAVGPSTNRSHLSSTNEEQLVIAQNLRWTLLRSPRGVYDSAPGYAEMVPIAIALGVVLAAVSLSRRYGKGRRFAPDVGPVSEAWLAEQRGRKDAKASDW